MRVSVVQEPFSQPCPPNPPLDIQSTQSTLPNPVMLQNDTMLNTKLHVWASVLSEPRNFSRWPFGSWREPLYYSMI